MALPPALGNDDIVKICDAVHYVEGNMKMMPLLTYPRGMTILCTQSDELVLVNPIRLDDETEQKLLDIGPIHGVVKIGMHDRDIRYYKQKFSAKVYAYDGGEDVDYDLNQILPPVNGFRAIRFESLPSEFSECVLIVRDQVLVACDALQCHERPRGSWLARFLTPKFGFKGKCIIPSVWLKAMTKNMAGNDNALMRIMNDFLPILDLNYNYLLSGHGYIIDGTAKTNVDECLRSTFMST